MSDPLEKIKYNKKSLLALFVLMSKTDNDIDAKEEAFIEEMRKRLGITEGELTHIWENENEYPLKPPKSEKHRMTIMYHLLYLIAVDGIITAEERSLMHELGSKLSVESALTEDLMNTMENHLGEELPAEKLKAIISKYKD